MGRRRKASVLTRRSCVYANLRRSPPFFGRASRPTRLQRLQEGDHIRLLAQRQGEELAADPGRRRLHGHEFLRAGQKCRQQVVRQAGEGFAELGHDLGRGRPKRRKEGERQERDEEQEPPTGLHHLPPCSRRGVPPRRAWIKHEAVEAIDNGGFGRLEAEARKALTTAVQRRHRGIFTHTSHRDHGQRCQRWASGIVSGKTLSPACLLRCITSRQFVFARRPFSPILKQSPPSGVLTV